MSITALSLAFYYYAKQLTFQNPMSLRHRQKSILEMFNKSPDFMRRMSLIKFIGLQKLDQSSLCLSHCSA